MTSSKEYRRKYASITKERKNRIKTAACTNPANYEMQEARKE